MERRGIIVIGASAGGVAALQGLCARLPREIDAAIFVVQHVAPGTRSVLPALLTRAGGPPAFQPEDGEPIRPGWVHVASPDRHLLVKPGRVLVRRGPRENRCRPAIDALFRSAAVAYGPRVVAAVLTGMLDDGSAGLLAVTRCGGVTAVQDPDEAAWPDMPRNALRLDHVEHCLPIAGLAELLVRLAAEPAGPPVPVPPLLLAEAEAAETDEAEAAAGPPGPPGSPSPLSCPDCGGVLNQIVEEGHPRFRCQVGHAFGPETLAAAQAGELRRALLVAVRTHRDRLRLFERMAQRAKEQGHARAAALWEGRMEEARAYAAVIGEALDRLGPLAEGGA